MIGKPVTSGSFKDTLLYCLEDKKNLTEEQKIEQSVLAQVQHKGRAEILDYHNCFGDLNDLTRQMVNVSKLNKRVEKPVFHFSIRPDNSDQLTREQLKEIGHKCAEEFGLTNNQYVIIMHKDSKVPHIHIVANRVDFDGKVVKDTYSINRMQRFTRRMEEEYHLRQVLSARSILPKEMRDIPRQNARLDKLKKDIQQTLEKVNTYQRFEEKMKSLGYVVLKGRGICFIDEKKVRIKGSEVGFSRSTIEKILAFKQMITKKEELLSTKEKFQHISENRQNQPPLTPAGRLLKQLKENDRVEKHSAISEDIAIMKDIVKDVIYELLKPVHLEQGAPAFISEVMKRKKKKQKHRHHL